MKLRVVEDADGTSVWVEDVPADLLDSEVKAAFEAVGGSQVERACALIGEEWVSLNLEEQRRLVVKILDENEDFDYRASALRLAELANALDEWLCKGGFLPAPWQKKER